MHFASSAERSWLPGAVDSAVPAEFRTMIGYGDMVTAGLALIALVALRRRMPAAIPLVWICLVVGRSTR